MTRAEADAATLPQLLEAEEAIKMNDARKKAWWQDVIYGPWRK